MSDYNKSKRIADELVSGFKYMYTSNVIGLISTLVCNYSLPLSQETINGVKDALIDHFFDGMDSEWEDYGMWQWFENLNPDWFREEKDSLYCNKSPKDFKEQG